MISQKVRPWLPGSNFRFVRLSASSHLATGWSSEIHTLAGWRLREISSCHDLPAEDGLAERDKIRQQLLDGGIAEEHADAIMRIVPYENGAIQGVPTVGKHTIIRTSAKGRSLLAKRTTRTLARR